MKLTTEHLKKLIQEELNEMTGDSMSSKTTELKEPDEDDLKHAKKAEKILNRLAGKYNNQTHPELYKFLGGAEASLSSVVYHMKESLGLLHPDELDV